MQREFLVAFKAGNFRYPNLEKVVLGFDRGYDCKALVGFITKHGGNIFGTAKRSLHNPFTYDQKRRGPNDKRIFKSKDGAMLVDKMIAPIKDDDGRDVANLVAIFYRNGYGGATMMQSTIASHQHDEWDRVVVKNKVTNRKNSHSFFKPHDAMFVKYSETKVKAYQQRLYGETKDKITIVTEDQNVWEWFCARRFSQTASAAHRYISIGLNDES